ncbi:hypothetical protein HG536_0G02560 [Torulaspora globosa]|uniref:Uncharacterized protein n=1 Tax=Torulaspora globosa TaxID=48254 RepID=A0A7G3ZLK9_9SACH|nr:uncharacterized protein HG536_0G02560 [Torulaspora globosa]QLL34395.1 hypothetical protein HG536_0G02560 [Torulaspora globosa]
MSKKRSGKGKGQPLLGRGKEHTQFLEALKLYESKSYKKSIKILDGILKKDSEYVDALALKALDLVSLGEKSEAQSYCKNALSKIDGTAVSPICCHVLGIYMRTVKEYAESVKWFQASLSNGSTNQQIYRDLATLQSQIEDFKGALVSRKKYWEAYLGYRANWTALAIAQDINGEHQQAVNTLSQFEKLVEGKLGKAELYENNECLMYKSDIMYRIAGNNKEKLQNVLRHLNEIEPNVYDKCSLLEEKASIYMKMGELKEASKVYRILIKRNPDDFRYYKLLEVSLGIQGNNALRKALYEKLEKFYPRSEPPKFIPLKFIEDEDLLSKKLQEYVLPQLKRGVPAAFCNVKPLYRGRSSIVPALLEKIVSEYLLNIDPISEPIPYIWTCYYLAQHFLFLKQFQSSQEIIDKAIQHTPTLVELYLFKGRVLKHLGLFEEAAEVLEEGRKLDLQDRFINTKTVKYFLRANNIGKATEVASLFTKNDDAVNGIKDLHLVEAAWFVIEQAEAHYRLYLLALRKLHNLISEAEKAEDSEQTNNEDGDNLIHNIKVTEWEMQKNQGLVLKRFHAIAKFYNQFEDDQLDFHSYCMRKGTPRAYLDMLKWGKTIYTKPMYVRAIQGSFKLYSSLHDQSLLDQDDSIQSKIKTIMKNHAKKAKKETSAINKRKEEDKKHFAAYAEAEDNDIYGIELLSKKEPLEGFQGIYKNYCRQVGEVDKDYTLEFEYQYRKGKLALCLGALSKYTKIHGTKSGLADAMAIVLLLSTKEGAPFDVIGKKVAYKGCEDVCPGLPIAERDNEDFDWLEYYNQKFKNQDLEALRFLNGHKHLFDAAKLKEMILQELSNREPLIQNHVLQYEL